MTMQFNAILEVNDFFSKEGIPYAIIGGIALQHWGEPRFTRDVDVTVLVPLGKEKEGLEKILSFFSARISDPLEFALKHRICLVKSIDGYEIDISLGIPGYEEEVIRRAVDYDLGGGHLIKICSAEDLIIHKSVAGRPQDLADIESIILRQGKRLDTAYIRQWLDEFSRLLEIEEVVERFERPWKKAMKRRQE